MGTQSHAGRSLLLLCVLFKGIFEQQSNEKSKAHSRENAALFDAAAGVEWLRGAATELHYSVYASVEGLGHALQFMLATDLWENLKEAVAADQIK